MTTKRKATKKTATGKKANRSSGLWMVKQEPESYSWDDFVREGRTDWTGVRNFQARNNLKQMKVGDRVLFYHSGSGKCVVGIAEVAKAAYADPTADDQQWVAVDLKPVKAFEETVPLAAIRYNDKLANLPLIRQSQLSVMPLTKEEFETIVAMGASKKRK
ncbi:MAG TPA: EVE domain-containing protein [Pyrinomonadaceae bacterium]|nr:EVE domain-containing protein [Pyrinomonadaceae bacterium]